MPPRAPPTRPVLPPGQRFKPEIEKARAEGVPYKRLLLRLTFGDASKLKRDPAVSIKDISFAGGETRYLGVKVVEGGVAASALEILASKTPAPS